MARKNSEAKVLPFSDLQPVRLDRKTRAACILVFWMRRELWSDPESWTAPKRLDAWAKVMVAVRSEREAQEIIDGLTNSGCIKQARDGDEYRLKFGPTILMELRALNSDAHPEMAS